MNPLRDYDRDTARLQASLTFWRVLAIGLAVACAALALLAR
jgi:hypothetical protein